MQVSKKAETYNINSITCKVPAMRNSSKKISFAFFLHHLIELELLITKNNFLSHKYLFQVEKYKKLEVCRFVRKAQFFKNMRNFLFCSYFQVRKISFSDSEWKTEYKKVIKSTLDPKLYWWCRLKPHRVHYVWVDFVNISTFST